MITSILTGTASIALAMQDAPPPLEHYARAPAAEAPSISPDGQRVAYIGRDGENRFAVVVDLESGEREAITLGEQRGLGTLWADDQTLLVRVGDVFDIAGIQGGGLDFDTFVTIDLEQMRARELIDGSGMGVNASLSVVAGRDPETGRLFMPLRDEDNDLNLYSVDPKTGARTTVARGVGATTAWVSAPTGDRHVRIDQLGRENRLRVTVVERGDRTQLLDAEQAERFSVLGFNADADGLILAAPTADAPRTQALYELAIEEGASPRLLFADDTHDVGNVLIDPYRGVLAGVRIEREYPETIWFDPELEGVHEGLSAAVGADFKVTLLDWTEDRGKFVFSISGDRAPAQYFVIDLETGASQPIALAYPELAVTPLPARRPVSFTARDGVEIPAYLTLPEGEAPFPLVLVPHGGPEARDAAGFDYWAHFLASRGYAVLQPNFRGSSGYGRDWAESGYGEWGLGRMQHDLTDAVEAMRAQGVADEFAILGGSYGGYAALAGAAFTPDLYECAISINGVADLRGMMSYSRERFGRTSPTVQYWTRSMLGEARDEASERAFLDPRSPRYAAENITSPVLLLHGVSDTVVPVEQSRDMERAIRQAGGDVRFVRLDGGDHWLLEEGTRTTVLQETERFLASCFGDTAG